MADKKIVWLYEPLPVAVAFLAGAGKEADGEGPFGIGHPHIAHEIVQMPDQRTADMFQSWVANPSTAATAPDKIAEMQRQNAVRRP